MRKIIIAFLAMTMVSCSQIARKIGGQAAKESEEAIVKDMTKEGTEHALKKSIGKDVQKSRLSELRGAFGDAAKNAGRYVAKTTTRIIVSPKNQFISKSQYLKWLTANTGVMIRKTGVKDAKVLRENMLAVMGEKGRFAKNTLKNGNQAHHIIGNETPVAASKLKQFGIDINDPMNGIFLPSSNRSGLRGVVHRGGHTRNYYDYVEQMFSQCKSKNDCYEVLDKIKSDLYKGNIKLYNEGTNKVNRTFRTAA